MVLFLFNMVWYVLFIVLMGNSFGVGSFFVNEMISGCFVIFKILCVLEDFIRLVCWVNLFFIDDYFFFRF